MWKSRQAMFSEMAFHCFGYCRCCMPVHHADGILFISSPLHPILRFPLSRVLSSTTSPPTTTLSTGAIQTPPLPSYPHSTWRGRAEVTDSQRWRWHSPPSLSPTPGDHPSPSNVFQSPRLTRPDPRLPISRAALSLSASLSLVLASIIATYFPEPPVKRRQDLSIFEAKRRMDDVHLPSPAGLSRSQFALCDIHRLLKDRCTYNLKILGLNTVSFHRLHWFN